MTEYTKRLHALREQFAAHRIQGFIVPSTDPFMGEYVPEHYRRLSWLSGFTGSNGLAIVLADQAGFFTDGRYVLQASEEVDPDLFDRFNSSQVKPDEWLEAMVEDSEEAVIGFDPWVHTYDQISQYEVRGIKMKPVENLVDKVWQDRPAEVIHPVSVLEPQQSGMLSSEKLRLVTSEMEKNGADSLIITLPDSVCWLFNLRGNDVPFTPLVHAYAIIHSTGEAMLLVDKRKLPEELVERLKQQINMVDVAKNGYQKPLDIYIKNCSNTRGVSVQVDSRTAPYWITSQLHRNRIPTIHEADPCQLAKAKKNTTEIENIRAAHLEDAVALNRFLHFVSEAAGASDDNAKGKAKSKKKAADQATAAGLTELDAVKQLEAFRKESKSYQGASFETISAAGAHGAIIHYRATEKSNAPIKANELYLVDSGGQYHFGTTDVTRTLAIGTAAAEAIRYYTLVLKGHLALGHARFPRGTTGSQLDALARQFLWQEGLDYDHGTGHGVGYFLGVHEGPQRVSKMPSRVTLEPGMVLSNEPGFYLPEQYGIRIENLVLVTEYIAADESKNSKQKPSAKKGGKGKKADDADQVEAIESPEEAAVASPFLCFETLTLAPYDRALIDVKMLNAQEKEWINQYHARVVELVGKRIQDKQALTWLQQACEAI